MSGNKTQKHALLLQEDVNDMERTVWKAIANNIEAIPPPTNATPHMSLMLMRRNKGRIVMTWKPNTNTYKMLYAISIVIMGMFAEHFFFHTELRLSNQFLDCFLGDVNALNRLFSKHVSNK